ncbi:MAG: hypothetical protein H6581_15695 [Bacteroidia bacterium]|nr:hypothetical protein [Bacteroidia bacterium]
MPAVYHGWHFLSHTGQGPEQLPLADHTKGPARAKGTTMKEFETVNRKL